MTRIGPASDFAMNSVGFTNMSVASGAAVTSKVAGNRLQAEVVCRCLDVTDAEIETAIDTCGAETVQDVGHCTGAGQGCTVCHRAIRALLENR